MPVCRYSEFSFDQGGSAIYHLTLHDVLSPSNDASLNATSIATLPFSDPVDLSVATTQAGEPTPSCGIPFGGVSRTVWYTFTPAETRSTFASNVAGFATVIAVYTGSTLATLTEVTCRSGSVAFTAEAGTTYNFLVGGLFEKGGTLEFRLGE